jgi:hypothetical protein
MAEPALAVEERGLLLGDDAQTSSSAAPRRRRRHLPLEEVEGAPGQRQ